MNAIGLLRADTAVTSVAGAVGASDETASCTSTSESVSRSIVEVRRGSSPTMDTLELMEMLSWISREESDEDRLLELESDTGDEGTNACGN